MKDNLGNKNYKIIHKLVLMVSSHYIVADSNRAPISDVPAELPIELVGII